MGKQRGHNKLRIFVASPGDVAAERRKVHKVVEELTRTGNLADSLGFTLEALDWQTHVSPVMGRPEDAVLEQLPVETWDIFIGILWSRFGMPTGAKHPETNADFKSGTEEEFTLAHRAWKKMKRPQILFYRCTRDIPQNQLDPDQFKLIKQFFEKFFAEGEHPGLYIGYETVEDFEAQVRQDLQKILLKRAEPRPKQRPAKNAKVKNRNRIRADYSEKKQIYLDFVYREHGHIRLFGFLSRANIPVRLLHVFVSLRFSDPVRELHLKGTSLAKADDDTVTPTQLLQKAVNLGLLFRVVCGYSAVREGV